MVTNKLKNIFFFLNFNEISFWIGDQNIYLKHIFYDNPKNILANILNKRNDI